MRSEIFGILLIVLAFANGAPRPLEENGPPMPHELKYDVNDEPSNNYFGHEEKGNEAGRTEGKYYVWLADGRLMTVSYFVEGDSGFVAKTSFEDNYKPTFVSRRR